MNRSVCLSALFILAPIGVSDARDPEPGVFYADFRGQPIDVMRFELSGDEQQVRIEPEGLRVTVVGDSDDQKGEKGLRARFKVYGDFEITTSYELLAADYGFGPTLGVSLYIRTNSPKAPAMMLGRFNKQEGGFYTASRTMNDENGKRRSSGPERPTTATSGKLRLVRRGTELTCLTADVGSDNYAELSRIPDFGSEEVVFLRIAALKTNGTSRSRLDARFHDLEVRSGDTFANTGKVQTKPSTGNWLVAAEVIGIVFFVAILAAWRIKRRRGTSGTPIKQPEVQA